MGDDDRADSNEECSEDERGHVDGSSGSGSASVATTTMATERGELVFDHMTSDDYAALDDNRRLQRALFALAEQTRDLLQAFRKPTRRRRKK